MQTAEDCELSTYEDSPLKYESPTVNVTQRRTNASGYADTEMRREFKTFQARVNDMLGKWFAKQNEMMDRFNSTVEDIKASITFLSDKFDDLYKKAEIAEKRVATLESQCVSTIKKVTDLEAKLDEMEQQSRHCNVEISNLPEKRGENLMSLVESIANAIKHPTPAPHITAIHRVPQANPRSAQPRNIVVIFTSQMIRDNCISAARQNKGVSSEQLNITGPVVKVFINEHLTLKNKILFREAREAAKAHGYRYVWIKHGRILVRATDTSPAFAVRKKEDVLQIKSKEQP